jgi:hypothetical protein
MENKLRKALHCQTFSYDTATYLFKEKLERLFGCPLEELHTQLGEFDKVNLQTCQKTLAHRVFYANYSYTIREAYLHFLRNIILPIVDEPFYYQQIPTFRIGLPNNSFVGEYHKDSFYRHQDYEVNFNLGLANYQGTAGLQAEKTPDTGDFITLESPYGTIFSFDHIDCLHGSDPNLTGKTMVSMDFRIAPLKLFYYEQDAASINTKSKFAPGDYFSEEVIQ